MLPEDQLLQLQAYARLLWEWNTRVNLTRHTDWERFVGRDLVDSLALAAHLGPRERVLDVGTGGGVPGVILHVLREDLTVALCESVGKRARAAADIVARLGRDVPVHHARGEQVVGTYHFNTLVVRAVAPMSRLLRWFRPHWEHFDRLLLVKGPAWVTERGEARHFGLLRDLALRRLASYPIPGSRGQSVILQICPRDRLVGKTECRMRVLEGR